MMRKLAMRAGWLLLAAAVLVAGSGCVAFNVGKPEVYTHTETVVTTNQTPIRTEVLSVEAKAQTEGNQLNAWLDADVREEFQRWQYDETVTVRKQRRLAVGVYPGWGRVFLKSRGALSQPDFRVAWVRYGEKDQRRGYPVWSGGVAQYPDITTKAERSLFVFPTILAGTVTSLGLWPVLGTLDTLLVEPLSGRGWRGCEEHFDAENGRVLVLTGAWGQRLGSVFDVSTTPKMKSLAKFTAEERKRMGILTCFDILDSPPGSLKDAFQHGKALSFSRGGILGVCKYHDVFVDPVHCGPKSSAGNSTKKETRAVGGPYEVELWVPGTGVSLKASVGAGDSKATFDLPKVERGGAYEATLEFHSLYAGTEDAVRKAWQTRTLKTTVWLAEKPKPAPVAVHAPQTQPVREVVREVVREIQYVERKPEGPPYDVEKTVDGAGRTVWRVKILAGNLNAFAVDAEVKPRILRELQDDFSGRNPEVPRGEINAFANYTTEDGGRTLVYVGVAESLIPSLESLTYSAETHRGTVTMQLAGGADLRHAKEFVRANISAIVCDKNVVLTAGERPPDGATYKYLYENFADGVLTVEFEAEK